MHPLQRSPRKILTSVPHIALDARVPILIDELALALHAPERWGVFWCTHRHSRSHLCKDIGHEGGVLDVIEEGVVGGAGLSAFSVLDCGR